MAQKFTLEGEYVRLEPLAEPHAEGLAAAAAEDPELYRLTVAPQGRTEAEAYIRAALKAKEAGETLPFATVRRSDGVVVGSTRFFDIEHWSWPVGHERHGRGRPDVCEIGHTWLGASAIRTAINTEAKLLMLTHAFETWGCLRVCLKTDSRNARSRAGIERLGARFEGILRAHRLAPDNGIRHTARYSIMDEEWPAVKLALQTRLRRG